MLISPQETAFMLISELLNSVLMHCWFGDVEEYLASPEVNSWKKTDRVSRSR